MSPTTMYKNKRILIIAYVCVKLKEVVNTVLIIITEIKITRSITVSQKMTKMKS